MNLPLVVGLGSHHGDDQAGWLVLERLRERRYPSSKLMRLLHPADLLDVTEAMQPLVICDACVAGASAGTIHRLQWPSDELCYQRASGSHDLPLGPVMELGRRLDCIPESVEIWALEIDAWSTGMNPSDVVRSAAFRVADLIWESRCHA